MSRKPKAKKAGRPPLPKGSAKAGTLRVRVTPEELKMIESKAKIDKQTVSEWIRTNLGADMDKWKTVRDGKKISFTYRQVGLGAAEMTAQVDGDEFAMTLRKSGLSLPLKRNEVEAMFPQSRFQLPHI